MYAREGHGAMLKDEPIEYIEEQFNEKSQVLEAFGEQVDAYTFYEDIFGDLETEVPVVIIDDDEEKRIRVMSVENAIEFGACRNDVLLGGCTYFNNWISKKSARDIHTFIIDYDNAYSGTLLNALQKDWASANGEPFAKPTYIVNSGTGLHLYFVLSEPIPNYHSTTENLDKLYRALAKQQARRVYAQLQVQWFGQDFRIAGGLNKYGWENVIYRIGDKWEIDDLAKAVGLEEHFTHYGEKRTTKPKDPKKRRTAKRTGWRTNRAFYDYTLENCREKTHEGNRYMSMCGLAAIAYKCGVSYEEVEEDLRGLLPTYNKGATRIVKEKEIQSALKMYNQKAMLTPRESIEDWQGWEYKPIKRNGQKREWHLEDMRTKKVNMKRRGQPFKHPEGRPKGVKKETTPKGEAVKEWQLQNPGKRKADCIRDTGLDRKTVSKYWT